MDTRVAEYAVLGGFRVCWNPNDPDRIHLSTDRPDIVGDEGDQPGLRLVLSRNPDSADYRPENFDRLARWLSLLGRPSPVHASF